MQYEVPGQSEKNLKNKTKNKVYYISTEDDSVASI